MFEQFAFITMANYSQN